MQMKIGPFVPFSKCLHGPAKKKKGAFMDVNSLSLFLQKPGAQIHPRAARSWRSQVSLRRKITVGGGVHSTTAVAGGGLRGTEGARAPGQGEEESFRHGRAEDAWIAGPGKSHSFSATARSPSGR
jgi:hypothetical protein